MVPVSADFDALSSLVTEAELESFEGRIVSRSFEDGALIDESAMISGGVEDGLRTMSIPVPVEHAAGARIVVGDRVDVITVSDGVARYVASDLLVVSHAETEKGLAGGILSRHRGGRRGSSFGAGRGDRGRVAGIGPLDRSQASRRGGLTWALLSLLRHRHAIGQTDSTASSWTTAGAG